MLAGRFDSRIAAGLLLAVALWGANNTGVKFLVAAWPPLWVGSTRFLCAGLLLWGLQRWTRLLGHSPQLQPAVQKQFWFRGGLTLAAYIAAFNWAVQLTAVSHVALYLGAAPIWALLWEGKAGLAGAALARRWAAGGLAVAGVAVLLWPAVRDSKGQWLGEVLGLGCSVLWTLYGRQCRALGANLPAAVITAQTMWRAGVWLGPLALMEAGLHGVRWDAWRAAIQLYCIVGGGVVAFGLWNRALRYWPTSRVYLFNNLVPASTMLWARWTLGEPVSPTFWPALGLIALGVAWAQVGQTTASGVQPAHAYLAEQDRSAKQQS